MARKPQASLPLAINRTLCDRDRLQCADHTLAQVESELHALENGDDDLTYLIEVLRCGVQRAIEANEDLPLRHLAAHTQRSTH